MQYITITDFILLPIYLFIVFIFASYFKNKYYPKGHPLRRFFMPAFTLKIFGAILLGIIYQYYYKGGDSLNYWRQTEIINSSMSDSFWTWLRLITGSAEIYDVDVYNYTTQFWWYGIRSPEYLMSVIGALIGLFTMTTYLPTAVIFAAISFIGISEAFKTVGICYSVYSKRNFLGVRLYERHHHIILHGMGHTFFLPDFF
jgi:hypothetical protein